nr:immunoglobulin light chain junction region [Macaca mulatta]
CMQALESPFTF